MANDLAGNPWVIDTPGATVLFQGDVHILNIELQGYAADTDVATIKDRNGKVIAQLNGASDLSTVRTGAMGWVYGIAVTALTTGTVRIYLR